MAQIELLCFVLLLVAALDIAARRIHLPYPVLMVLCGLGVSLIPGLPRVDFDPALALVIFLPPLLYPVAYFTSWRDFIFNLRAITLLAVGLVLATMCTVAWVAHSWIPGFSWPAAFLLGAIVSPPDAVAATAIFTRLDVPRRLVTVLEGESMINDAVALVTYRFAVAAVVTGSFSLTTAAGIFPLAALGGVAIGLAVGAVIGWIQRHLDDPPVQITLSLLTPFAAYLPAEHFGASGVLAVVAAGLYLGWRSPRIFSARFRLEGSAFWRMVVYLLNGVIFIFIGLQLPRAVGGMRYESWSDLVFYAGIISGTVIALRLVLMFPIAYLPRWLFPQLRARDPYPSWRSIMVVGWSGMRGVISMAAALALPLATAGGAPFPARDAIIFLSFSVILVTLVLQGLSLPLLIRFLGVEESGDAQREEKLARVTANRAALSYLDDYQNSHFDHGEQLSRLQAEYRERLDQLESREAPAEEGAADPLASPYHRYAGEALQAERRALIKLRDQRRINDETLRTVQRDIDLADARIVEAER